MKKIVTACVLSVLCVCASSHEVVGMKRGSSDLNPESIRARGGASYNTLLQEQRNVPGKLSLGQGRHEQQEISDENLLKVGDESSLASSGGSNQLFSRFPASPETSNGSDDENYVLNEDTQLMLLPSADNLDIDTMLEAARAKGEVVTTPASSGSDKASSSSSVERKTGKTLAGKTDSKKKILKKNERPAGQSCLGSFFGPVALVMNNIPQPDLTYDATVSVQQGKASTITLSVKKGTGWSPAQLKAYSDLKNNQSYCVDLSPMFRVNFTANIVAGLNENSVWKQIVCPSSLCHLEGIFRDLFVNPSDKSKQRMAIKEYEAFLMDFSVASDAVSACQYSPVLTEEPELHAIVLPYNSGAVNGGIIARHLQMVTRSLSVADSEKGTELARKRIAKEGEIQRGLNAVILRGNTKLANMVGMPPQIRYVIAENKDALPHGTRWYHGLRKDGPHYWMAVRK